jgi:hypothetical protein
MHAKAVKMRAKIKDQQKGKQSNKQSLVRSDKVIPSGVAILSQGARRRLATAEALSRASWCEVLVCCEGFRI